MIWWIILGDKFLVGLIVYFVVLFSDILIIVIVKFIIIGCINGIVIKCFIVIIVNNNINVFIIFMLKLKIIFLFDGLVECIVKNLFLNFLGLFWFVFLMCF